MKSKNVKVVDEHNIDRDANVMFAFEVEGSEYVAYWISRDEESNNVFVSKLIKNIDNTYNMINIDDEDKKKDVAETVKVLISNAVSDQNDKIVGNTVTLSNGKVIIFISVLFNKEQHINVTKTYITTVKKEVTKVAGDYYDIALEETKVEEVLPAVTPEVAPVQDIFPNVPETPVVEENPVVQPAPTVVEPITAEQSSVVPTPVVSVQPEVIPVVNVVTPTVEVSASPVVEPVTVTTPEVVPTVSEPVIIPVTPAPEAVVAVETPVVAPTPIVPVQPTPVPEAAIVTPTVEVPVAPAVEPVAVATPEVTPAVPETPVVAPQESNPALIFNAAKESNLNAALGEVANSTAIPVEKIEPIREFGVETPAPAVVPNETPVATPTVAPMAQPVMESAPKVLTKKAGFANSKFFMVVAVAFFLASCVFLGYEVYNYFQIVK